MKKGQKYFSKRCRLCGRCFKESVDIFSPNEKNLQELIHQCLNINIREDDALPKKLCQYCDKKLLLWEKFKNSCENIQVKLIADSLPKKVDTPKSKKCDKVCKGSECISGLCARDNTCAKLVNLFPNHSKRNEFGSTEGKTYSEPIKSRTEHTAILRGLNMENEAEKDDLVGHESGSKAKFSLCKLLAPIEILKHKQTDACKFRSITSQGITSKSKIVNISHEVCEFQNSKAGILEITDQEINDLNDTISKNLSSEEKLKQKLEEINNNVDNSIVECKLKDSFLPKKQRSESKPKKRNKSPEEYSCSICNGKFHSLRKLKTHFKEHLSESNEFKHRTKRAHNKHLQCPHCPRKLSTSFNLRHHLETHSEACNYCCHLCGKLFRTHSSLLNHIRVHLYDEMEIQGKDSALLSSGKLIKLFQCQICDKKFRQSGHLAYHLKMHSGERLYNCSDCGLSFTERYQLRKHTDAVHNRVKRYTCDVCGKQFLHTHNFKDHMLQHDGIANVSCDLCGKAFITSNALSRHRRLHTGEKPFSCDICGKTFRDCSNRKRHRDKHIAKAEEALSLKKSGGDNSLSLTVAVEKSIREESSDVSVQKTNQIDRKDEKASTISECGMEVKTKKTYMSLKTYFESNDDVSLRDEVKRGGEELILPIESLVTAVCTHNSGLLQSIPVVGNDESSNSAPLLGCGLFGEELDLNSENLLLIGDGRVSNGLTEGAEVDSEGLKDQLVCWVPSSNAIQDVNFNGIIQNGDGDVPLSGIQNGDVGLAGIQVGDIGLSGVQGGDITGILEVGMELCSDFDCHSAIGLDSGKDELSNDFPSIGEIKEVEESEKGLENVFCLQVF